MDQTTNLKLPYIMPSQAQKHVTHNEAIRALDALVQLCVLDRDLSTPPASPLDGSRYLVAAAGAGAWTGKDGKIAAWQDGAWAFFAPQAGWLAWVADEQRLIGFDGAAWADAAVHSVNPAPLVGVNATADATNRLSLKSPASLFDHDGGDHRLKINKALVANTASIVFQTGYSGRAEFGLAGDDDWRVKVSPDGSAWVEALKVDAATGRVRLPAALALSDDNQVVASRHIREKLTGNRTYYVRTDGSNANNGLANTVGGAFLTIQRAYQEICKLDLNGFNATISVADGSYAAGLALTVPWVGGNIVLSGSAAAVISVTNTHCIQTGMSLSGALTVSGMTLQTAGAGNGVSMADAGRINLSGVTFGPCASAHIAAQGTGAIVQASSDYTIAGSALRHWHAEFGGLIRAYGRTITLTGAPAFTEFARVAAAATVRCDGNTYVGAATGSQYHAYQNGVISRGGTTLPGSTAGTTATGGVSA